MIQLDLLLQETFLKMIQNQSGVKQFIRLLEVGNHPYQSNNNNWYKYCQLQKANNVSNLNIMKTRNKSKELIKEQMNYI